MNYKEYVEFAKAMFEAGLSFMVEGEPGTAKTALTEEACHELGFDLIVSHPAVRSPIDYGGIPAQLRPAQGKKAAVWDFLPIGDLRRLCDATRPTVFFMDDYGQGSTATQNATSSLIHSGQIGENKISPHVRICAATNRAEDKSGTNPILEHIKGRFHTIVHLDVDHERWCHWAANCEDVGLLNKTVPMPQILPAFIAWKGLTMLMDFKPKPGLEKSKTPRTVHQVGRLLAAGAVTETTGYEVISRAVDKGFAVEFLAFLKLWAHLPDPEDVLNDPSIIDTMQFERFKWDEKSNKVMSDGLHPISQRPDVAYSLVTSAAEIVDPGRMANFVDLLQRFQKPVEVMGMLIVNKKGNGLLQTPAFISWASANQQYMM